MINNVNVEKKLISVITVCLNAEKEIGFTIDSVLKQDYTNYEYLIKDGGSDDSTIEIAEKYINRFSEKNIPFRIISEKDEGLYDAMNQSAQYAKGEWIIYINAGDELFDNKVLSLLSSEISDQYDILYGDAVLTENEKYKLLKAGCLERFKYTNPICHQASLTRTDIIRKNLFDKRYFIASDFDLFLRLYLLNDKRFKKPDIVFCVYRLGGVSNNRVFQREKEFNTSRKINGLKRVAFPHLQIMRIVFVEKIRKAAIIILGKGFYSENRGWYSDKYKASQEK